MHSVAPALEPDVAASLAKSFPMECLPLGCSSNTRCAAPPGWLGTDADAEHLLRQDVIDALVERRNLIPQTLDERLVNLAQEYARLRCTGPGTSPS